MEPIINVEEKPDKVVGRKGAPKDAFAAGMRLQETAGQLGRAFGLIPLPTGAFRFRTHEEADEWMLRMLARHRRS